MRIDRKRALRIGGRTAGFLAAAALAVGTVVAAALVPWPDHRVEAPSVLVQPAESRQQRVCPARCSPSARMRPPRRPPRRSDRPTS